MKNLNTIINVYRFNDNFSIFADVVCFWLHFVPTTRWHSLKCEVTSFIIVSLEYVGCCRLPAAEAGGRHQEFDSSHQSKSSLSLNDSCQSSCACRCHTQLLPLYTSTPDWFKYCILPVYCIPCISHACEQSRL